MGDIAPREMPRDDLGHRPPAFGEVIAVEAPIEHLLRIVHLAMAHEVDQGALAHGAIIAKDSEAADAALGKAASTRSIACSSWAAETNHAS